VGNTDAFGLDAVFPAVLLALVLPLLTDRGTRAAAVLGTVIAVAATPVLPAGVPVLLSLVGLAAAGWTTAAPATTGPAASGQPATRRARDTGPGETG
jgi:predicted branched-subunit amino acid permease